MLNTHGGLYPRPPFGRAFLYSCMLSFKFWTSDILKNNFVVTTIEFSLISLITLIILTARALQTLFSQPFLMHLKSNMKMSCLLKIWRCMAKVVYILKVYGKARSTLNQRESTIIPQLDKVLTKRTKKVETLQLICFMRCKWVDFRLLLICTQSIWHLVGILKTLQGFYA